MNTPKDSTAERTPGSLHPAGSAKSRYWRVTRKPENQRQSPGEYSSNHILVVEATREEALDWATGYFPTDKIVNVELWPCAPTSPNVKLTNPAAE